MKEVWDVKRYINHNKSSKRKGRYFWRLWDVFDSLEEAKNYCSSNKGTYQISSRLIEDESKRWPIAMTFAGSPIYDEGQVVFPETRLDY